MRQALYQVDAFTREVFSGNPAAVCPLERWLPEATMQSIAAENNLSETAFFAREGDGYHLRWFTPAVEVDLCGHATLASAWVLFNKLGHADDSVTFHTLSGKLEVARQGDLLVMDFPARPANPVEPCAGLLEALGGTPEAVLAARDHLVVYATAAEVRELKPDMARLQGADSYAAIATAPGEGDYDCVSRFFAPAQGVPEDPVTGSAHCTIVPYWAERLGKSTIRAYQASSRGGELICEVQGDRVAIAGNCSFYMQGTIEI
jgi:PhzF family phenazine biosynthesis protein